MVPAVQHDSFVEPALHADAGVLDLGHSEVRTLRQKRRPDILLALRPARTSDGDALQTYVRELS